MYRPHRHWTHLKPRIYHYGCAYHLKLQLTILFVLDQRNARGACTCGACVPPVCRTFLESAEPFVGPFAEQCARLSLSLFPTLYERLHSLVIVWSGVRHTLHEKLSMRYCARESLCNLLLEIFYELLLETCMPALSLSSSLFSSPTWVCANSLQTAYWTSSLRWQVGKLFKKVVKWQEEQVHTLCGQICCSFKLYKPFSPITAPGKRELLQSVRSISSAFRPVCSTSVFSSTVLSLSRSLTNV